MKVLNEKFANEMKKINLKYDYGLTKRDCECYSNIFNVLYEIADKQLDFYQIFDVYDFFTDVLGAYCFSLFYLIIYTSVIDRWLKWIVQNVVEKS